MIVSTAPGRCGLVGNPTDMYGGSVISITTRERARCELAESGKLTISCGGLSQEVCTADDLRLRKDHLDICRAVLSYFQIGPRDRPFSLTLTTELPMQAGMAGSTALVVAAVGALDHYLGLKLHPWALAETARKIEAGVMRILCGLQDQHMAVFGGVKYMDFAQKEDLNQRDDEPLATIEPLAAYIKRIPLLAAHTGHPHDSGLVHRSPRDRWLEGEGEVREAFCKIAQLARLAKRSLLAGDWGTLGEMMNENHRIVERLGGSGPQNERLIQAARDAGALGAKLAGAGGGGTILAIAANVDAVREALLESGADIILFPEPGPGLQVNEAKPASKFNANGGSADSAVTDRLSAAAATGQ